jgi:DNA-binding MarR family transcriptional regulator
MNTHSRAEAETRGAVERLRLAVVELLGAERRLRGRDHGRPDELTHAQLRALAALGRDDELTAGQLARQADLNPASVTAMLDQLEAAEVVQRRRSTEDRRVCNVSLTPHGWELLEEKLARWNALWNERCGDLSDRELETAARVIDQIAEMLDSVCARPGAPNSEEAA